MKRRKIGNLLLAVCIAAAVLAGAFLLGGDAPSRKPEASGPVQTAPAHTPARDRYINRL